MDLKINGTKYYVERHQNDSDKPSLLLLHGFMGSGRSFQTAIPLLKDFVNPFSVDLLGHGKTEGADSAKRFTLDRQIVDLKLIIEELFRDPPFLYGYSMGGRLAVRYALAFPQTINGLIIESTNYGLEDQSAKQERQKIDEERAQAIEADFPSFVEEWQTLSIFKNEKSNPSNSSSHPRSIQWQQDPRQMANSLRGFGTAQMPSVKDELSKLTRPVLILVGQEDSKYAKIGHDMHELFRDSSLKIIPCAGHRVHIDQLDAFVLAVKKFIMECSTH